MKKVSFLFILLGGILLSSCDSAHSKPDVSSEYTNANIQSSNIDVFETSENSIAQSIMIPSENIATDVNTSISSKLDESINTTEPYFNNHSSTINPDEQKKVNTPDDWEEFTIGDLVLHLPVLEQTKKEEILTDKTKLYEYFDGLEVVVNEWRSTQNSNVDFIITHFKLVKGYEKNHSDGNFGQLVFLNYDYDDIFDNIKMASGREFQIRNDKKTITIQSLNAEETALWTYYNMKPDNFEYWDILISSESSSLLSETLEIIKDTIHIFN